MIDPTMDVLYSALNGLMTEQQVIANNVANLSTPNFTASQVDFEDTLQAAIANGTPPPADPAVITPSSAPANQDGNNVDVNTETLNLTNTELRYQAITGAVNAKFQELGTAIQG
jgi:flagellar basal-body rod protein FlgB